MIARLTMFSLTVSTLALLSLAPAGCGGGDGGGGGGDSFVEPPFTNPLPEQATFTDDDIRHLLSRTQFGVTTTEFNLCKSQGVLTYIDNMARFPTSTQGYENGAVAQVVDWKKPSYSEVVYYWTHIMQFTTEPFQEHLAMFWHDHFATSQNVLDTQSRRWMPTHIDLLRHNGNGNLRTLLYRIATDPVMLVWLDGIYSTKYAPNENFAREFWEIFSLGADNGYTQADIEEAAKCFTGWRTRYDAAADLTYIEFDPTRHDTTDKTFFGQTVVGRSGTNAYLEYQDVVDVTLSARGTQVSEYIVKRLWEHYVYPNPDPATIITPLATLLRTGNWELRPILKAMFRSQAFYSSQSKDTGFIKDPVEMFIGFSRTTGLFTSRSTLYSELNNAAQLPAAPPTVFGWPPGDAWLSSQGVVERANYTREAIRYRTGSPSAYVYNVADKMPPVGQRSDAQVVDWYTDLLRIKPSPSERQTYIDYLNNDYNGTAVIADPWDPLVQTQLDKKVRGLLYMMAQHPTYYVR